MTADRDSFLRLLDQAISQHRPTNVAIAGAGSVAIYPERHCYVSDIADWDAVVAGGARLRLLASSWGVPPIAGARPLEQLRWRAALHDHWIAPGTAVAASHDLLHLASWPNLSRMPPELLAPVARICALLWRKPTVAYLVPRVLQLAPEDAARLLAVLQAMGHVTATGSATAATPAPAGPASQPIPRPVHPALRDTETDPEPILARLWQRLLRVQVA